MTKKPEVSIIITAWDEPKETKVCIKKFLEQDQLPTFEMFVICPDKETKKVILDYKKKYKQIHHIHQDRKIGKNEMLVQLMNKAKGKVLIFTDGDIYVSKNTVKDIMKAFKNPKIGCVSGRPVSINPRNNMMGYWSHLLVDAGAHNMRKYRAKRGQFVECTGYLFAIRNGILKEIPLDVAEDSIIPALFWAKGYKIGYVSKALAEVEYPTTFKDWISQKTRCAKAHEKVDKYAPVAKMKSFGNELLLGTWWALSYPKNIKEFIWTLMLFPARAYVWVQYFYQIHIKNDHYGETWRKIHAR